MPLTLAAVTLRDGIHLPYAEHGDPDGTPVVFLHGMTDSWRSFERVLPHLPAGIHAYAVTQRGHGDATRTPEYDIGAMAGDIAGFMDAVGLAKAVICGSSMGSTVTQRFAIDHPERCAGIVLAASAPTFSTLGIDEMAEELAALTDPIDPDYLRGFQESTVAQPVPADLIDAAVAESAKVSAATFRQIWDATVVCDFSAELGAISAPTLVLWGTEDAYCPRGAQDALLGAIRGSRLVVYAGAGHAMHWEQPERFAADVARFAEEVTR